MIAIQPNLAFLDHKYHMKTRSSDFLLNAFKSFGWNVRVFYDDEWEGGSGIEVASINEWRPLLIVSFQIVKKVEFYHQLLCQNVIFVPMFDSSRGMKIWDWIEYEEYAFLNFSRTLHRRHVSMGMRTRYVQYFPDPRELSPINWELRKGDVFFWERVDQLSIQDLKKLLPLISQSFPTRLHWHISKDPAQSKEPVEFNEALVTRSTWFESTDQYREVVRSHKVYIAPRFAEGIGMSFLEAMALGCVVVAHNAPTMNEYIQNGVNGILLNFRKKNSKHRIAKKDFQKLGENARIFVENGFQNYQPALSSFIEDWEAILSDKPKITFLRVMAKCLYKLRIAFYRPLKRKLVNWKSRVGS